MEGQHLGGKLDIISDRLITAKLLIDTININIVSAFAPQVGCTDEENEEFWEELEELIRSFSEKDKIVVDRSRSQSAYWKR